MFFSFFLGGAAGALCFFFCLNEALFSLSVDGLELECPHVCLLVVCVY